MKFQLTPMGRMRSDCTSAYAVMITEQGTVRDFIDTILRDKTNEWGYIGIASSESSFGQPRMEYAYGKSNSRDAMKEYENKQIQSIRADGGWSRMDYILYVM